MKGAGEEASSGGGGLDNLLNLLHIPPPQKWACRDSSLLYLVTRVPSRTSTALQGRLLSPEAQRPLRPGYPRGAGAQRRAEFYLDVPPCGQICVHPPSAPQGCGKARAQIWNQIDLGASPAGPAYSVTSRTSLHCPKLLVSSPVTCIGYEDQSIVLGMRLVLINCGYKPCVLFGRGHGHQ